MCWLGHVDLLVVTSDVMSHEAKLVKSSISALSVDICLLWHGCSNLMSFSWAGDVLLFFMLRFSWQNNFKSLLQLLLECLKDALLERLPGQAAVSQAEHRNVQLLQG